MRKGEATRLSSSSPSSPERGACRCQPRKALLWREAVTFLLCNARVSKSEGKVCMYCLVVRCDRHGMSALVQSLSSGDEGHQADDCTA